MLPGPYPPEPELPQTFDRKVILLFWMTAEFAIDVLVVLGKANKRLSQTEFLPDPCLM